MLLVGSVKTAYAAFSSSVGASSAADSSGAGAAAAASCLALFFSRFFFETTAIFFPSSTPCFTRRLWRLGDTWAPLFIQSRMLSGLRVMDLVLGLDVATRSTYLTALGPEVFSRTTMRKAGSFLRPMR